LSHWFNPYIVYDNGAKIAEYAHKNHMTLLVAGLKLNFFAEELFNECVQPEKKVSPDEK